MKAIKLLDQLNRNDLPLAGGKGANLGGMIQAGLPVPPGFCVTTDGYRAFVAVNALDEQIQRVLESTIFDDPASLEAASVQIRQKFQEGKIPPGLMAEIQSAYQDLAGESPCGSPKQLAKPVAVRSSATAEDLPDLSFAGQQDTYLNIIGEQALLDATVRCWASLWTARAIGYRAHNAIPQESIALAVVIQQMVASEAAGVLFTANPLTGKRSETVIDATLGLGEALVSGQVEPDQYVVDGGKIISKTLGAKALSIRGQAGGGTETIYADASQQQAIPDEQIFALARLGQQAAQAFGGPQDIEWAFAAGKMYVVQSRPITSLFPLPVGMPPEPLKVMVALSSIQGMMEPFTPLGQEMMKLVLTSGGRAFGLDVKVEDQTAFYNAAERIYINFTAVLSNPLGRKIFPGAAIAIDPGVSQAAKALVNDVRLAPKTHGLRLGTLRRLLHFFIPTFRRIRQVWKDPAGQRTYVFNLMDSFVADAQARLVSRGDIWEDYALRLELLFGARDIFPDVVIPNGVTVVIAGMIPFFGLLQNFARQVSEKQPELAMIHLEIARGLPYNVTTEMDLSLWQAAQTLRADVAAAQVFESLSAEVLAQQYLRHELPPVAQEAVTAFLQKYGMRGIGEIDMGRPRWREQPAPIMQVLQSYLKIDDPEQAPDVVFARGAQSAEAAADRLVSALRATHGGRIKARLARWAVTRYRALAGLREAPKFFAIRMMGVFRQGLLQSGQDFVAAGLLDQPDDLFFLYLAELTTIAEGKTIPPELRERIAERRQLRQREMRRKQLPRVLLSDGTAYYEGVRDDNKGSENVIAGSPVSPGVVEGIVHVVFEPHKEQLAPGEILVCPGTDPAWTPLFLAAGGLVMEVGGLMTHGSVVAREYGIPAVVGVSHATTRLKNGQKIRVDGTSGQIVVLN